MDALNSYDSSPERAPRRPPPPADLHVAPLRKRSRKHVALPAVVPLARDPEQFLVHVQLPIVHDGAQAFFRKRMGECRLRLVGDGTKASFSELTEFHVSVARPGKVRPEQIGTLVKDLGEALADCKTVSVLLRGSIVGFLNGNGRRLFLAAPLRQDAADVIVKNVVRNVDRVFYRHGLPLFFDKPRLHVSFAWTECVDVARSFPEMEVSMDEEVLEVTVDKVACSIGKSNYWFTLK